MADLTTFPQDRIRIFNREGINIAEFRASVERSWVLGEEGRAVFGYPIRKTEVVNENIIQFGNYILIENSVLPPWVGVIDVPRVWGTRAVEVYAYTPERMLNYRRSALEVEYKYPPGTIFKKLIQRLNRLDKTLLTPGDIWEGGSIMELILLPNPLSDYLYKVRDEGKKYWNWRPVVTDMGRLVIYGDYFENLGETTEAILQTGNVEAVNSIMVEDEPLFNDILGYGDGETWGSKPYWNIVQQDSIAKYGLRQSAEEYQGVTDKMVVKNNVYKSLEQVKNTKKVFRLTALNKGDTFKFLKLGNRLKARLEGIGFTNGLLGYDTLVQIEGMAYDPQDQNQIELVVTEVI